MSFTPYRFKYAVRRSDLFIESALPEQAVGGILSVTHSVEDFSVVFMAAAFFCEIPDKLEKTGLFRGCVPQ